MADLLLLAKMLQEQLTTVTTYLEEVNLTQPSFLPSQSSLNTSMDFLPPAVEEARKKAQGLSWSIYQLLTPPSSQLMGVALSYVEPICIRFIIEKKIAAMIPRFSRGVSVSEIAQRADVPKSRLVHIMRQLTAVNIFREPCPGVFAHTAASSMLDDPQFPEIMNILHHYTDEGFRCTAHLPESLTFWGNEFDRVEKSDLRTAFNLAFNTEKHYFDFFHMPENLLSYGKRFSSVMVGTVKYPQMFGFDFEKTVDLYDWNRFEEKDKIVIVGGGIGHEASRIAPRVRNGVEIIVETIPEVIEYGKGVNGHLATFQPFDLFQTQPVVGAQLYFLRHILRNWPDEICRAILGHVYRAMNSSSTLLICEAVLDDSVWACGKNDMEMIEGYAQWKRNTGLRNLYMMALLGSKERSRDEWNDLLRSVGLTMTKVYGDQQNQCFIEAKKM